MSLQRAVNVAAVAVLLLALDAHLASAQCAMCRLSLAASADGEQLAAGLRSGILLLLAAPFSVFALVAAAAWRLRRALERADEQAALRHTIRN